MKALLLATAVACLPAVANAQIYMSPNTYDQWQLDQQLNDLMRQTLRNNQATFERGLQQINPPNAQARGTCAFYPYQTC
jgi:hypothetical protein